MTCQLEPWKRGQRKWVQSTACAPGEAAPDSGVYGHLFSYYCWSWAYPGSHAASYSVSITRPPTPFRVFPYSLPL